MGPTISRHYGAFLTTLDGISISLITNLGREVLINKYLLGQDTLV